MAVEMWWPDFTVAWRQPPPRVELFWNGWLPPSMGGPTPEGFEDLD